MELCGRAGRGDTREEEDDYEQEEDDEHEKEGGGRVRVCVWCGSD